ncbi:MAG: CBS domain-containing protein [Candidatus Aenigmarchaeota archaeon]|nr:CBS domain-containing protein [Candidatus Aenigmarchaeota archaeon]
MIVKQLMSKRLVTIDVDRNLRDAKALMEKNRISRLLVKDDEKIIGMITERDIANRLGTWKERRISDARIFISSTYSSNLIKINQNQDISLAAGEMLKRGISSLAVCDNGNVVGILTKTDVIKALKDSKVKVRDWMSRPVVTLGVGAEVLHARILMLRNGIKRVPIVLGNRLVGIVTEKDIAKALGLFRKLAEGRHWDEKMKKVLVEQIMSRDIITVDPEQSLGGVVEIMFSKKVSGLPVVENDRLVGIVTKTDLVRVVAESKF